MNSSPPGHWRRSALAIALFAALVASGFLARDVFKRLGLVVVNRDPLGSMARAGLSVAQQIGMGDMIDSFYHPSNLSI